MVNPNAMVVFVILILVLSLKEAGMRTQHLILALVVSVLLVACSSSPNASPINNSGTWDQSNFESANWN